MNVDNSNDYHSATLNSAEETSVKIHTTADLWKEAWSKAGRSLFYMQFIHPDVYLETDPRKLSGRKQMLKVEQMCYHLAAEWNKHFDDTEENRNWFREWIGKFGDEVGNQC